MTLPDTVAGFDALAFAYLALAVLIVETAALAVYLQRRDRRLAVSIVLNGASGACLIAALITVLNGAGLIAFLGWLSAAFAAHLLDLVPRLRQHDRN